jgi:hypothetical protein
MKYYKLLPVHFQPVTLCILRSVVFCLYEWYKEVSCIYQCFPIKKVCMHEAVLRVKEVK